jgi:NADH ubiquinone oxidoreductase, 20 Kd subunit
VAVATRLSFPANLRAAVRRWLNWPHKKKKIGCSPIAEIEVLWITAGLAANGDDFLKPFHQAAEGKIENFILVIEGSIPNEHNKAEAYWASFGTDSKTGQPILTCDWIDRLAPKAWAVVAAGTCATYGGIHAMEGNPRGSMGLPDYLGWQWKPKAQIPIVRVPGCPVPPDNFMETCICCTWLPTARPISVTEGEDKPLKYPTIFNSADVAIVTKTDLAAAVEFNWDAAFGNIQAVRPGMRVFKLSTKTGEGVEEYLEFLAARLAELRSTAEV